MVSLTNWQRNLNLGGFSILIILIIFIFIFYESLLFSRLSAERYLDKAMDYLHKSHSLSKDIIVEKSVLYYKGLKLLKNSARLNPFGSRPYFEYAEAIAEAGGDPELSSLLDMDSFSEGKSKNSDEFYELAKAEYIKAILREPTNAIYHQRLADIYNKLSDTPKTEEELKKAILLDPQNVSIHLYLSQYFLYKDKQEDFLSHLNRVVELYKKALRGGGSDAKMVRDFLKAVGREELIQ